MSKYLGLLKAVLAIGASAAMVFNRGNSDVAVIAILTFGVTALPLEAWLQRRRPIVAGINFVGLLLVITFASVMSQIPTSFDRFFMLALLVAFFQLLSETAINIRDGWFKAKNRFHLISWVLNLLAWGFLVGLNPGAIAAIGAIGSYLAILAVHWGIEAAGPKPAKED